MRVLILLLVASACIAQTCATTDKTKEKITGAGEASGKVVGIGADEIAAKAQDNGDVSKGKTITGFVANQAKKAYSLAQKKISDFKRKNEAKQSGEQEQPRQSAKAQPPKEKMHLLTGLVEEFQKGKGTRTRRSVPEEPKKKVAGGILSKLKSLVQRKNSKSGATKTEDNTKPKVEAETKPEVEETKVEKSDAKVNDEVNEKAEPSVKSKTVTEASETKADESEESEGEEVKRGQSVSDDRAEHVRSKRSSDERSEPEKERNPLKRLANKLHCLGNSSKSKPKQESGPVQKPKNKKSLLERAFGDLDGDGGYVDKDDNLYDEISI